MNGRQAKARERLDNGLCPQCGEEAAPFYLCYMCRQKRRFMRAIDRMIVTGSLTSDTGDNRGKLRVNEAVPLDDRWATNIVPPESDRRFRPRIGGIPVNVEAQIWKLCESFDREFSIDDVVRAWGRLRGEKRKRGSAAADVRAILAAEEKRRRRAEKHRALHSDSPLVIEARAG